MTLAFRTVGIFERGGLILAIRKALHRMHKAAIISGAASNITIAEE